MSYLTRNIASWYVSLAWAFRSRHPRTQDHQANFCVRQNSRDRSQIGILFEAHVAQACSRVQAVTSNSHSLRRTCIDDDLRSYSSYTVWISPKAMLVSILLRVENSTYKLSTKLEIYYCRVTLTPRKESLWPTLEYGIQVPDKVGSLTLFGRGMQKCWRTTQLAPVVWLQVCDTYILVLLAMWAVIPTPLEIGQCIHFVLVSPESLIKI